MNLKNYFQEKQLKLLRFFIGDVRDTEKSKSGI